ncbi:LysR substrate-binding domain-containing protein [Thioclava kandeliae]|uniref:LysR substrate-binding domain-containing protein n=1 Tax=Thioclava kandeliae TaxID=3070818 RepID=A0ABV1SE46_9RHOB
MSIPRRFLPTMSSLRALEAVDRLGTAVAAAQDLDLTHSAVSRQLRVLEEQLGVKLFLREGKRLGLTSAGQNYARAVRDCLDTLAQASLSLRAAGDQDSLSLAVPLTFGLHWLAPRLARFAAIYPALHINQSTRNHPVNFATEPFDAAILFGLADADGLARLPLAENRLVPVGGTTMSPPAQPRDLLERPLLHLASRPGAWESWFADHDIPPGHLRGPLFDQFLSLAHAARSGMGLALLPDFLAEPEIAQGSLIRMGATFQDRASRYYLAWPADIEPSVPLKTLIRFLETDLKARPHGPATP